MDNEEIIQNYKDMENLVLKKILINHKPLSEKMLNERRHEYPCEITGKEAKYDSDHYYKIYLYYGKDEWKDAFYTIEVSLINDHSIAEVPMVFIHVGYVDGTEYHTCSDLDHVEYADPMIACDSFVNLKLDSLREVA